VSCAPDTLLIIFRLYLVNLWIVVKSATIVCGQLRDDNPWSKGISSSTGGSAFSDGSLSSLLPESSCNSPPRPVISKPVQKGKRPGREHRRQVWALGPRYFCAYGRPSAAKGGCPAPSGGRGCERPDEHSDPHKDHNRKRNSTAGAEGLDRRHLLRHQYSIPGMSTVRGACCEPGRPRERADSSSG
jgi:hypothetical protein